MDVNYIANTYCDMTPKSLNNGARVDVFARQRLGKQVPEQLTRTQQ
jgi:hypothetical protein